MAYSWTLLLAGLLTAPVQDIRLVAMPLDGSAPATPTISVSGGGSGCSSCETGGCGDPCCEVSRPRFLAGLRDRLHRLFDRPSYGCCSSCCIEECCGSSAPSAMPATAPQSEPPLKKTPAAPAPLKPTLLPPQASQSVQPSLTIAPAPAGVSEPPLAPLLPNQPGDIGTPLPPSVPELQPSSAPAPLPQGPMAIAPAGATTTQPQQEPASFAPNTRLSLPLANRFVNKVGHGRDYGWVIGQVHLVNDLWVVRYGVASDEHGGHFILQTSSAQNLQPGALVQVRGEVANNPQVVQQFGAPLYRAHTIEVLERGN